jgi:hypothetical protein
MTINAYPFEIKMLLLLLLLLYFFLLTKLDNIKLNVVF